MVTGQAAPAATSVFTGKAGIAVEGTIASFECGGCQKVYRWKPELAGKKVKCKCGHAMVVPMPVPVEAPPVPESDDPFADALASAAEAEEQGAYALAPEAPRCPGCKQPMAQGATLCVNCGYNVNTGKKPAVKVEANVGGSAPTGGAKGGVGLLPYRRPAPSPTRGQANNNLGEPVKDLYIPLGMFLLGVILAFIETRVAWGIRDFIPALITTLIFVVLNIVLVFGAIMIAVKMLDLGLGPVGPAMLKIAAIAVLPGAVAGVFEASFGFGGGWLGRIAGLLLTYVIFMWLMELDGHETRICTAIIWLVRTFGTGLIIFGLVGALGISAQRLTPIIAGGGGAAQEQEFGPYGGRYLSAKEMDTLATRLLAAPRAMEAGAWLAGAPPEKRLFKSAREGTALDNLKYLHDIGAKKITVTLATVETEGEGEWAQQLVIELPASKEARQGILEWNDHMGNILRYDDVEDKGQKYLVVDYEGKSLSELYDGSGKKKKKQ